MASTAESSKAASSAVSREASSSPRSSQDFNKSKEDSQGGQVILRIKRKRNQDPVDALIIQQNERRNKRRSIVFSGPDRSDDTTATERESEGPTSSSSRGVFRLAETVSVDSFSDPVAARKLHQRIAALSGRSDSDASSTKPNVPSKLSQSISLPVLSSPRGEGESETQSQDKADSAQRSLASSTASLQRPADRVKALASEQIERERGSPARHRSNTPTGMRFKVIQKDHASGPSLHRSGSTSSLRKMRSSVRSSRTWQSSQRPPEIRSKKANEAEAIFGRIIDAEADSRKQSPRNRSQTAARSAPLAAPAPQDPDMAGLDSKFAEMLGSYLRSNDIEPSADIDKLAASKTEGTGSSFTSATETSGSVSDVTDSEDEDYVYDIYYREVISRAGPQGSAEVGLQPAMVPGRQKVSGTYLSGVSDSLTKSRVIGGDVAQAEAIPSLSSSVYGLDRVGPNAVIAHLEGLEDSEDELEQPDEDGFESYDEGEDEDSNDEGFYRNDYPEQELPDDEEIDFGSEDYENGSDRDEHDPYALSDASF